MRVKALALLGDIIWGGMGGDVDSRNLLELALHRKGNVLQCLAFADENHVREQSPSEIWKIERGRMESGSWEGM